MAKSIVAFASWAESQRTANLVMIAYWCSTAITFICEIAAVTILAAITTNRLDGSESWMAVWFFAVNSGIAWIVGHHCLDSVSKKKKL